MFGDSGDSTDPEEYSAYFPKFMWVVRDFSLQLEDGDGNPISSKDYLELALQKQKGFSDSVEQKNKVRKLIHSFFKDRDCFTMVRPHKNEEIIQELQSIENYQLRPKFVE
jgi:hypothetical protein